MEPFVQLQPGFWEWYSVSLSCFPQIWQIWSEQASLLWAVQY